MIKRAWQLASVGLGYVSAFITGFGCTFMMLWGLAWLTGVLLEFVTKTSPVYNDWFRIFIVVAGVIISFAAGAILLGVAEREKHND